LEATNDNWESAFSEGLGKKFTLAWDHPNYSGEDFLLLRLGEPILPRAVHLGLWRSVKKKV